MVRALTSGGGSFLLYFWNLFCVDKLRNLAAVESLGVSPLTRGFFLVLISGTSGPIRGGATAGTDGADFLAG